jgi:hypothetical protein
VTALLAFIVAAMTFLQPGIDHTKLARATAQVIDEEPALFLDDEDKLHTASLVVAIMFRESSFRHGVVSPTNDHCEMQVHERPDLDDDRVKCVRTGMRALRASFKACPGAPLAQYVGGGCTNKRARRISDDRIHLGAKVFSEVHP